MKCERCGVELTEADFVPCSDITECPLLNEANTAMHRALTSDYLRRLGKCAKITNAVRYSGR